MLTTSGSQVQIHVENENGSTGNGNDETELVLLKNNKVAQSTFEEERKETFVTVRERPTSANGNNITGSALAGGVAGGFQEKAQNLSLRMSSASLKRMQRNASYNGSGKLEPNADDVAPNVAEELRSLKGSEMETDVHFVPISTLVGRFNSNVEKGLSMADAQARSIRDGKNILTPPKQASYLWMFCVQLVSGFNFILWLAAIVTFLSWEPLGNLPGQTPAIINVDVAVWLVIVILFSAFFNFYQEVTSLKIVAAFNNIVPTRATALRNGEFIQLDSKDLFVGDIVSIKLGDKVPADLRLIKCENTQVDNSALTGESEPVTLSTTCSHINYLESSNLAFFSALIIQGTALGIVTAIADNTVLGQVNKLTQANASTDTSLHREIRRFVWIISFVALFTGVIAFIGWGAWLQQDHSDFIPISGIILSAISLIVAYVPEGLPICVTMSLTLVAKKMYAQRVLVTNIAIAETFNSVSVIATDKTGTLTQNKMSVASLLWGWKSSWLVPIGEQKEPGQSNMVPQAVAQSVAFQTLVSGAALCNNAQIQLNDESGVSMKELVGDSADTAFYNVLTDHLDVNVPNKRLENQRIVALPFNSSNKFMITMTQDPENQKLGICFLKGAPEIVVSRCSTILDDDGIPRIMDDSAKIKLLARQESLGKLGYRVIGMCQQRVNISSVSAGIDSLNGLPGLNYCFIGMLTLLDPPRPAVPSAVLKARSAGIRVFMVTGDHPSTAEAIAKQTNIFTEENLSHGLHSLKLVQDGLGRASMNLLRDGAPFATHVIGSETSTALDEADAKKEGVQFSASAVVDNISNIVKGLPTNELSWKGPKPKLPLSPTNSPGIDDSNGGSELSMLPEGINPHADTPIIPSNLNAWERLKNWFDPPSDRPRTIPYSIIVTGNDIKLLDNALWSWVLSHQEIVFARTSPEQKLRVVMELQSRNEVVAVTGDGVNDAPALKKADIGVAMFAGVEVAREAGDMILLDNDFSSLIKAIEIGRLISDNLKKVCLYLLPGSTWSEMWPVMFNVFLGMPTALSSFEMIVCSVVTDVFDALALVQEGPEDEIMTRPPLNRNHSHLVDFKLLWHAYVELGFIISVGAFLNFFWYCNDMGLPPNQIFFSWTNFGSNLDPNNPIYQDPNYLSNVMNTGQSIYFVSLITMNFFSMFATRTRYASAIVHNPFWGPHRNLWLVLAVIFSSLAAILITQAVWFQTVFFTAPVPVKYICPSFGFGAFLFLFDEFRKWWVRKWPKSLWGRLAW